MSMTKMLAFRITRMTYKLTKTTGTSCQNQYTYNAGLQHNGQQHAYVNHQKSSSVALDSDNDERDEGTSHRKHLTKIYEMCQPSQWACSNG
jgi:hypothetical protein